MDPITRSDYLIIIINKTGKFRESKKPDFAIKHVFTERNIECLYVVGRSFKRKVNVWLKKNFQTRPPAPNKKEIDGCVPPLCGFVTIRMRFKVTVLGFRLLVEIRLGYEARSSSN